MEDRPDDVPLRIHVADLLVDQGDSAAALAHCSAALERDPGNAEALAVLSRAADRLRPDDGGERPDVTLSDVGGLEEVKRRLEASFLVPMRNPEMRRLYGRSLPGGLLLYGPPGCGKTFLARAIAGELGAGFYTVSLSDVLDMWVGSSERNLHGMS
ncbi:ATP-binding protein [Nonomuraea sp. NPDC049141]|uniref:ATP-binding protein n=1 Tax=Nonomuraea sp. NPDC049141 TaxID=3155500 RepID=UPI00340DB7C2